MIIELYSDKGRRDEISKLNDLIDELEIIKSEGYYNAAINVKDGVVYDYDCKEDLIDDRDFEPNEFVIEVYSKSDLYGILRKFYDLAHSLEAKEHNEYRWVVNYKDFELKKFNSNKELTKYLQTKKSKNNNQINEND